MHLEHYFLLGQFCCFLEEGDGVVSEGGDIAELRFVDELLLGDPPPEDEVGLEVIEVEGAVGEAEVAGDDGEELFYLFVLYILPLLR